MDDLLRKIWRAELPLAESKKPGNATARLEQARELKSQALSVLLDGRQEKAFVEYVRDTQELISVYREDAFVLGIQFATKFILEGLDD